MASIQEILERSGMIDRKTMVFRSCRGAEWSQWIKSSYSDLLAGLGMSEDPKAVECWDKKVIRCELRGDGVFAFATEANLKAEYRETDPRKQFAFLVAAQHICNVWQKTNK